MRAEIAPLILRCSTYCARVAGAVNLSVHVFGDEGAAHAVADRSAERCSDNILRDLDEVASWTALSPA
jgi:hypothetical protein